MATYGSRLRQGLPRIPGRDPWPAPGGAPLAVAAGADQLSGSESSAGSSILRCGLPRTPGGEPWPSVQHRTAAGMGVSGQAVRAETETGINGMSLRRGLPRTPGGGSWPPAGVVAAPSIKAVPAAESILTKNAEPGTNASDQPASISNTRGPASAGEAKVSASAAPPQALRQRISASPAADPERNRVGPFTRTQWVGSTIIGAIGLVVVAGIVVLAVRWILGLDAVKDFMARYPGEYSLPGAAPIGIPGWLGWQHFFNFFLMVLIIRSGLRVRTEKRPTAYWAPRTDPQGKVSLMLWFHQSLDILWLINGAAFLVLLFGTGQWMRIIPTSWEVFPNALSAALQYLSLQWPTENGWVNYNSLQQLAYFTTIFLAAPLAAISGARMSGIWPKKARALNKAYPIELARKIHFPVMLFFVVFIAIHVFLVFATGALRNLNHMYAATGSIDGATYTDNWAGFWFFAASLAVTAIAWVAAHPLVLAPVAKLFGTVSSR